MYNPNGWAGDHQRGKLSINTALLQIDIFVENIFGEIFVRKTPGFPAGFWGLHRRCTMCVTPICDTFVAEKIHNLM